MPSVPALPPEIELVLLCARTTLDSAARARAEALLQTDLDWVRVVQYALAHKVVPIFFAGLSTLESDAAPDDLLASMRTYTEAATANHASIVQLLSDVLQLLGEAKVPVIAYKGPVLAAVAYRDLDLREYSDVDLLVHPQDVPATREALLSAGFHEIPKRLTWEAEFRASGGAVDLHWRIAPAGMEDYWIGFDFDVTEAFERRQSVSIRGCEVPCFDREDMLLAQCQSSLKNGFNHALAQLRWVCDIAELIRAQPPLSWETVLARATACRSRRALLVCLALAHTLLGAPLPESILTVIRRDRFVRYLAHQTSTRYLAIESWQPVSLPAQLLYAGLVQDTFARSLPYLKRCLSCVVSPNEVDRAFIRLPPKLHGLYFLIRPVRLLLARGRKKRQAE